MLERFNDYRLVHESQVYVHIYTVFAIFLMQWKFVFQYFSWENLRHHLTVYVNLYANCNYAQKVHITSCSNDQLEPYSWIVATNDYGYNIDLKQLAAPQYNFYSESPQFLKI